VRSEDNMVDSAMKNLPEKLFVTHVAKLKNGEIMISQREDVRADKHLGVKTPADDIILRS